MPSDKPRSGEWGHQGELLRALAFEAADTAVSKAMADPDGLGCGGLIMTEAPLRFRDLTSAERGLICNGCGSKAGGKLLPAWCRTASCDHHDFNYWRGGKEADRLDADQGLYEAMRFDASLLCWMRRPFAKLEAWAYYHALREHGADYFNYAPTRRGRESLNLELAKLYGWKA